MHCHLGLISFIQGVRTGLLWCKEAGTLIIQSRVIVCGGRRVCDEITRQGRILMQRQYTSNLVDSEALEARWYCSILNFQLYLAVILLFHLFWEFFEGKTICGRENKHKVVERMMMVLQMASESQRFAPPHPVA
ncbi:uncharacterized protein [Populus alba]|uniref:uncharacterized protein n=1 Tax=Populus alba TaxID=43335 RepID=UPI003CC769F2